MELFSRVQHALKIAAASVALVSCDKVDRAAPDASLPSIPPAGAKTEPTSRTELQIPSVVPFTASDAEHRMVVVQNSLEKIANRIIGNGAAIERMLVMNGVHPSTTLVPGSHLVGIPDTHAIPDIDRDPTIDPAPVFVELQKGQTLWYLARCFHVDERTLIALNCSEGEREVRNLQEGRRIDIPLVQRIPREGKKSLHLEGLCIDDPADCERIAHRLLKSDSGMSTRLDHLSRAFQYLPPAERHEVVGRIAEGLDAASDKEKLSGEQYSNMAYLGRLYADALRSAVGKYSIDNPFRVSPLALLEIVENRRRLDVGDRAQFGDRILMVCTSDGDANGAFSSVNTVIETAMSQGINVVYFQTGSCSEILKDGQCVKSVLGRGADGLIIAGHGGQVSVRGEALVELGYSSAIRRAQQSDTQALGDLCLSGADGPVLEKIAKLVRPHGSIGFISCFSGEGGAGLPSNLVNQLTLAATRIGHYVHVVGCQEATNVESVDFKGARLRLDYLNGGTYELSVAKPTKP
jgi:hypothetical protein